MKFIFSICALAIGLCSGPQAQAANWQKIAVCENGSAVIDVNTDERREVQLVLRGNDLLGRLHNAGMVYLQYGQQEVVIRGVHSELRQTSPTTAAPASLGGVFNARDFRKMLANNGQYGMYEVEARGREVALKTLYIQSGTSCTGEFEGECQGAVFHQTYVFQKEYILRGCYSL
jgi:hypothetical protein